MIDCPVEPELAADEETVAGQQTAPDGFGIQVAVEHALEDEGVVGVDVESQRVSLAREPVGRRLGPGLRDLRQVAVERIAVPAEPGVVDTALGVDEARDDRIPFLMVERVRAPALDAATQPRGGKTGNQPSNPFVFAHGHDNVASCRGYSCAEPETRETGRSILNR